MIKVSIAHYNLIPLLFLSQVVLHSAQESKLLERRGCSHFDCGRLGKIGYPFFTVGNPKCGVIALNCTVPEEPKVQFREKGKWYLVNDINYLVRHIEIHQPDVQKHLALNRCDLLETFTEQAYLKGFNQHVTPFLSFNITETHPFFKCKHKPSFTPTFFNQFDKHSCTDYDLYFKNQEKSLPSLPKSLSDYCSVVHLTYPRVTEYELGGVTANLILQWGARFKIHWNVLQACLDCFEIGGECMNTPYRGFKCGKKGGNVRRKIEIAALSAVGVGIMGVILSLLYCTRLRSRKLVVSRERATRIDFEAFIKQQVPFAPKRFSFKAIKRITSSFKDELGRGGYGSVFKGTLHDGKLVAVKVLSETKGNGEEFINEVASISRTSHVNIVSLLGYCFEGSKRALIYEFMPNGSLEKYIYGEQSSLEHSSLGWETLYQIAVGIARGLEYLHRGCNTRILHFDIKPHNILLDQDFCPKISDFGLAKLCPRKESIISLLGARGTAGYIAPEVFSRNFGGISHKSDVYSYGMMILEMVGGRKNIDIGVDHTSKIYFPSWIYKRIELNEDLGLLGIISETQGEITRKMILVGLWCIQTNPLDRPAISRVLDMLEGSLDVLEIPPKPYFSSSLRIQEGSSNN